MKQTQITVYQGGPRDGCTMIYAEHVNTAPPYVEIVVLPGDPHAGEARVVVARWVQT